MPKRRGDRSRPARNKWRNLHREIADPEWSDDPSPVSAQALDAVEAQAGLRLPASYRGYITVFGPGELALVCNIRAPGYGALPWPEQADLRSFHEYHRGLVDTHLADARRAERGGYRDPDRMGRLYFFGDNARADLFGWDPADVRDRRRHEYGVYILGHGAEGTDFLAASFAAFVEDYCLGDGCLRYWGLREWPFDEPQRSFWPSV